MSNLLVHTGINDTMISPFTKMIRTPTLAYWIIGLLMMTISFFFWPSPTVALMGAILLPVAVRVGLPPIGVAIAMNLFGHGIALSGDFVIQGAPKLTADAAWSPCFRRRICKCSTRYRYGRCDNFRRFFLLTKRVSYRLIYTRIYPIN